MTEINKRIEEVKKICPRCKGAGKIIWHDRQSGAEFKGTDIERPCPNCQLFPQPLDDKELRRKLAEWVAEERGLAIGLLRSTLTSKSLIQAVKNCRSEADYIYSALLQPKIEEAKKQQCENCSREDWAWKHMYISKHLEVGKGGE